MRSLLRFMKLDEGFGAGSQDRFLSIRLDVSVIESPSRAVHRPALCQRHHPYNTRWGDIQLPAEGNYQLVMDSQEAAIQAIRPGIEFREIRTGPNPKDNIQFIQLDFDPWDSYHAVRHNSH